MGLTGGIDIKIPRCWNWTQLFDPAENYCPDASLDIVIYIKVA
jgi:hypothetical protein